MKKTMKLLSLTGILFAILIANSSTNAQTNNKNAIQFDLKPLFQTNGANVLYKHKIGSGNIRIGANFSFTDADITENDTIDLASKSQNLSATFGYEFRKNFTKSSLGFGIDGLYSKSISTVDYWSWGSDKIEEQEISSNRIGIQPLINFDINFTDHFYFSAETKSYIGTFNSDRKDENFSREHKSIDFDLFSQMMFYIGYRF